MSYWVFPHIFSGLFVHSKVQAPSSFFLASPQICLYLYSSSLKLKSSCSLQSHSPICALDPSPAYSLKNFTPSLIFFLLDRSYQYFKIQKQNTPKLTLLFLTLPSSVVIRAFSAIFPEKKKFSRTTYNFLLISYSIKFFLCQSLLSLLQTDFDLCTSLKLSRSSSC